MRNHIKKAKSLRENKYPVCMLRLHSRKEVLKEKTFYKGHPLPCL